MTNLNYEIPITCHIDFMIYIHEKLDFNTFCLTSLTNIVFKYSIFMNMNLFWGCKYFNEPPIKNHNSNNNRKKNHIRNIHPPLNTNMTLYDRCLI